MEVCHRLQFLVVIPLRFMGLSRYASYKNSWLFMRVLLCTLCQRFLVFLLCNVEVVDIGGMVLAVVQLHDLCVDVGLQGAIVICQIRECVLLP